MPFIFLNKLEQWPDVNPYELKRFLDRLFEVNPEVRWSGTMITTEGRMYFHLDEWSRPGDMYRRCRAYFDLATPGDWHVSSVPPNDDGDALLLATEEWYQRYWNEDRVRVIGVGERSEDAA